MQLSAALAIIARNYNGDTEVDNALARFCNELADLLDKAPVEDSDEAKPLTDDSAMPFGKHRGKPLRNVPTAYWQWLVNQPEPVHHTGLAEWLNKFKVKPTTSTSKPQQQSKLPF